MHAQWYATGTSGSAYRLGRVRPVCPAGTLCLWGMIRRSLPDWLRRKARVAYGDDPASYDVGRPEYPARVYELLGTRCGVGPGTKALEIGPGTGRVTRRLFRLGAIVTAVEPDPRLAENLATVMAGRWVNVVASSFEDAPLADNGFDAAVAAMSFHWVDQDVGLAKLGRVLRPKGWVALWWTVFGDPDRPDPFK